ncbi:hypothetical protein K443DRAFT_685191 [Laccaria amethystina LaAM-08-1]|uniref:Uncharacterized protein n=1 Tax=Laccaria amethystina LaAM-08-1 TaxID=1095629 RepID=A0A0C9WI95_9AGAR|nr:hypothetical protein K443DRAFT_685191 [Laccaria amethystina LaAM-08-1]
MRQLFKGPRRDGTSTLIDVSASDSKSRPVNSVVRVSLKTDQQSVAEPQYGLVYALHRRTRLRGRSRYPDIS